MKRPKSAPPASLPYRVGLVEWTDAHGEAGWIALEDIDQDPVMVQSIALVVGLHLKPDHLTVAQDLHPDGRLNGVSHIPLGMVKAPSTTSPDPPRTG